MKINLKITLLRSLLALTLLCIPAIEATAASNAWFRFDADLVAEPTGAGKVYGQFAKNATNNAKNYPTSHVKDHKCDDKSSNPSRYGGDKVWLHLYAEPNAGYEFVKWEEDNDTTKQFFKITTQDVTQRTASVEGFKPFRMCASSSKGTNDGSGHPTDDAKFEAWRLAHGSETRYKAVFRKIETEPKVTTTVNNESYGSATNTPAENDIGDQVQISTHTTGVSDKGYRNRFIGWQRNGEYIYDENGDIFRQTPYTFTITEDNAGVYTAVYQTGYDFFRVKNYKTNRWFDVVSNEIAANLSGVNKLRAAINNCLRLYNDFENVVFDPGSIVEISTHKVKEVAPDAYPNDSREFQDFHIQNISALGAGMYEFPATPPPSFLLLKQNPDHNSWVFENSTGFRFVDNADVSAPIGIPYTATDTVSETEWHLEGMDLDLTTHQNYFSLIPSSYSLSDNDNLRTRMQDLQLKKNESSGLYYTTLRVAWNLKFDNNQINAYIVNGVDDKGVILKTQISGDVIPAKTPVLLECKSDNVLSNAMIPVTGNYSSAVAGLDNALVCSESYFPRQNIPDATKTYKGLGLVDGRVGFVRTVNPTKDMSGNCGYLQINEDAFIEAEYQPVTLANLVEKGETEKKYEITDVTLVESVPNHENDDQLLICKDDNGRAQKDVDQYKTGMIDYMAYSDAAGMAYSSYDESNWVMLRVPAKFPVTVDMLKKKLGNVKGRLTNKVNPEFLIEAAPEAKTRVPDYVPNLYIPSSFAGTQTSQVTDKTYFFVTPKPMELARVKWAIWDGDEFTSPSAGNEAKLGGSFGVNQSYMQQAIALDNNMGYSMTAVIKVNEAGDLAASPRRAAPAAGYVAWPLQMQKDQQIITGVSQLVKPRQVAGVVYYDIAGQPASTPRRGLNIVVTRYSDGSSTAEKRIY